MNAESRFSSSTTIFLFDKKLSLLEKITKKHKQIVKEEGWVEHDADEIYINLLNLVKKMSKKKFFRNNIFLSITNQRETFVIFELVIYSLFWNAPVRALV